MGNCRSYLGHGDYKIMSKAQIDFAIIGVQKAGTTALAAYLDQHSGLYLPPTKEFHLFRNVNLPQQGVMSEVRRLYKEAPPDQLWGEATPLYLFWPGALELMHGHNPAMRLIVSLRHPVERAYSAWSMECRRGRETQSFSNAIREGQERQKTEPKGSLIYSYIERGFYGAQIKHLLSIFPREQVFFLRADDIHHESPVLQQLLDFLTVDLMRFSPLKGNIFPSSLPLKDSRAQALQNEAISKTDQLYENLKADFQYLQKLYQEDLVQVPQLTGLKIDDWLSAVPSVDQYMD